ncbi:MAG: hypothetical protein ACM34K_10415 [Bacillota bacterium]
MQNDSSSSLYKNWSIEKGDYVRKGLSKGDQYHKAKVSTPIKILLFVLGTLAVGLGYVLFIINSAHN